RGVWYPQRRLGKPELASPHGHDSGLRRSLDAVALLLAVVSSLVRPLLRTRCCKLGKAPGPDVGQQKLACRVNSVSVQEICWGAEMSTASTLNDCAAILTATKCSRYAVFSACTTAARVTCGAISFRSCGYFVLIVVSNIGKPVTLPPGRA